LNLPFRFIILLLCVNIYAQENYGSDILELKSGKVYRGEIVYESSNEVALKNMLDGQIIKISKENVLSISTEKTREVKNKELKNYLSKSGEYLIEYVDDYLKNIGIAFFGYLVLDYGFKNPVKTVDANDDRNDQFTLHPAVFAGSGMVIFSTVSQIFNIRKIKRAGEELKKAGNKL